MPQPEISSQPVCLQMRQPAPSQNTQDMSTSADGSVNGKYDGRSRIFRSRSKNACTKPCRMAFMFAKLMSSSDHEPFDLVEHRRVRHVGIAPIHAPRRDHRERRAARQQRTDLHRRGVRAQQPAVREIERVVHRPRRMVRRDVERFEVVEVVLDLGPGGHVEARATEQRLDAQPRARHGMQPAALFAPPRQRDVDAPGSEAPARRARARAASRRASMATCSACFASLMRWPAAGRSRGRQRAERLQLLGERALLAEPAHAHLVERGEVAAAGDLIQRLTHERVDVARRSFTPARRSGGFGQSRLRLLGDRAKRRRIVHRDVGEHLAVDFDAGLAAGR